MRRFLLVVALASLVAGPAMAADATAHPMACCAKGAGVERTVANLDNGVKITMTAKDPKAVAMIQEHAASCPKGDPGCKDCPMGAEGVTRTVEKTESGVVITATAGNPELVKKLQAHAATSASGTMKGCCKGKADDPKCPHAKGGTPTQS